jgi:hypothetical protein
VLVEVARVEEVGLLGMVVLALLAIEVGAVKRVLGSCNQGGFSVVSSKLCAIKPCIIKVSAVKAGAIESDPVKTGDVKAGLEAAVNSGGSDNVWRQPKALDAALSKTLEVASLRRQALEAAARSEGEQQGQEEAAKSGGGNEVWRGWIARSRGGQRGLEGKRGLEGGSEVWKWR